MPQGLTVISDILVNQEPNLRARLDTIGRGGATIHFDRMLTVHYAAWLILPGVNNGPARLLFETNYDGPLNDHLNDLITHGGIELDRIYSHCAGYNAGTVPGVGVKTYFHNLSSVYYVALPGRTLADIRNAIAVYEEATAFLNSLSTTGMSKSAVDDALIAHFRPPVTPNIPQPQLFPVTQRGQQWRLAFNLAVPTLLYLLLVGGLIHFKLSTIAAFLVLFPVLYVVVILLAARCQELVEEKRPPPPHDSTSHRENFYLLNVGPQNHLCTLATLRPGWFRRYLMKQALVLGTILSKYVYILGKLDLMPTIHFARWILINNELVFLSNYDGSFSSYLSDFSDQAWGVNLVWGNTEGFPPTRFLYRAGAQDLDAFEMQGLKHFYPAPVFYSAYEEYPVQNLLRYLDFRDDLARRI